MEQIEIKYKKIIESQERIIQKRYEEMKEWREVARDLYMALRACDPPGQGSALIRMDAMKRMEKLENNGKGTE